MEESIKKFKRIEWVDIAKAFAIILMVVGHECPQRSITTFIFSFHMPLFFIMSGYTAGKDNTWSKFIKKSKKSFVMTWLLAALMIIILGFEIMFFQKKEISDILLLDLKGIFWGSNYGINNLNNVGVMWFLIVFFWAKLLYNFLEVIIPNEYNGFLLGILSYFAFVVSSKMWLPQAFDIVPIAAWFMWIGAYLKSIQPKLKFNSPQASLMIAIIFIYWIVMMQNYIYIDMSVRHYPFFIFSFLEAVAGTISVSFLSSCFSRISQFKILKIIGKHTLAVLCIHHLDLYWLWWGAYIPKWYFAVFLRLIVDFMILGLFLVIRKFIVGRESK